MNPAMETMAPTEFDIGPLTWVKSEIDLALERAGEALDQFADGNDATQLKFARSHLHQVRGALTIVGLDGITQFVDSLEGLLDDFEQQKVAPEAARIALARRALDTVRHYLDDLINGAPDQPLRLAPTYSEIQLARGETRISCTDLFFPDLSLRPPRRPVASALSDSEVQQELRAQRARFQRGLLGWLRKPDDPAGLGDMRSATEGIEATQELASARAFWWVAGGLFAALADGRFPVDADLKQLCARIDAQIRRLIEGSKNVAERLMRDTLYYVALSDSDDEQVRLIKETYQLQRLIPAGEASASAPEETLRRRLRETIAAAEEAWNRFCSGTAQALPAFCEHTIAMQRLVEQLGHTDYRRLAQAIANTAGWLAEKAGRQSESLSMEIATAILLAQNAQENLTRLGPDFAHQVDVMVARLHGFLADNPPEPGSEVPLLDEMSRQAQEKLLVGQVAREIQSNLAQVEQVLDDFFRDATKRHRLAGLAAPLHQIVGALTMMGQGEAVETLHECESEIQRFASDDYVPDEADFTRVADKLSALGFFIDSMQHGSNDFGRFRQAMNQPPLATTETSAAEGSVEEELARARRDTQTLLQALHEQPADENLRQALKQNLETLKQDADLVADSTLGQQAKAALSALNAGAAPAIDEAFANLRPPAAAAPPPLAQTLKLAGGEEEAIDAELLSIFIEEAHEVLDTIGDNLDRLHRQPHNAEVLTNLRRSFHTLKGSGRMVGLRELGETAWSIEQVLNLWLRQELDLTPPVLQMIADGHQLFSAWVGHLQDHSLPVPETTALLALAESLRNGGSDVQASGESAAEAPAEADAGADAAQQDVFIPEAGAAANETADGNPGEIPVGMSGLPDTEVSDSEASDTGAPPPVLASNVVHADFAQRGIISFPAGPDSNEVLDEAQNVEPAGADEAGGEAAAPASGETSPAPSQPRRGASLGISAALYDIFLEEAGTHIATLNREFESLNADPGQATPFQIIRAAHTLAGISGTVGITAINRLGATLEHALRRRETTDHPESAAGMEIIGQAITALAAMVDSIANEQPPSPRPELLDALEALYPTLPAAGGEQPPAAAAMASDGEAPVLEGADAMPAANVGTDGAGGTAAAAIAASLPAMRDELDEQLLPIFLEEAGDLVGGINEQLRQWRANPDDREILHALHRLFHTLKGSARMAGAMTLGEITHAIESRIEQADKVDSVPAALIDDVETAFDAVVQIIEHLQQGDAGAPLLPAAAEAGHAGDVEDAGEIPPPATPATAGTVPATPVAATLASASEDASAQKAVLRVRADLIDRLVNDAGELSIARTRIEGETLGLKASLTDLTENVIRLRRQLRDIEIQAESQMQSRTVQADERHAGFDPLEFDRFTQFQELTRMMAESVNDVATVQQHLLKSLDDTSAALLAQARINRRLQQQLMSVRMVPFASQADRLHRIVRQTAKELGKRANLEIRGGQVELDRSVLDKIGPSLEHLLRNAVAHGLESRERRQSAGKPEIGEVTLTLAQEGNEIIVTLADDGAGLDFERIRAQGIASGLLDANEVADEGQLIKLIFAPGFSTATELNQIAGRGIGMDVVKTEIGLLGGRIEVHSTPGRGSTFRLYIPLTLAVTQALLVRAGASVYAIPSAMIEQVLELKESFLDRIREAGETEWLGNKYPYRFLPHLLGDFHAMPEVRRRYWVLLLRSGAQRVALQVDELRGNREIVVKNIGPQLVRVIGIDGATVLGDGQVVLILNPVALASRAHAAHLDESIQQARLQASAGTYGGAAGEAGGKVETAAEAAAQPTVMVVDDSLTVRKITGRLLAREGYRVLTAKDGVDALEQMLDILPDVLLVDIEMPRMDGFDFTRNVRADDKLKHIPIIMITSRTADKHRNYALEIGANHYLGKPYQEEELLGLISAYVHG